MKLLTIFDIFAALQLCSLSYYSPPNASIFNYERFEKLNEKISGREKVAISIMPHELLKYALECTILFHFSFFSSLLQCRICTHMDFAREMP